MSRLNRRQVLGAGLAAIAGASRAQAKKKRRAPELNVLLIGVADLRPELGCYGSAEVLSPHIDRLARGGLTLLRSYAQDSVDSSGQEPVWTGRRPEGARPGSDLDAHFAQYGYRTAAFGQRSPPAAPSPLWESAEVEDDALPDGKTAAEAAKTIRGFGADELFFVSVRFQRPSLPFRAPKSYYDLYPKGLIKPTQTPEAPVGSPSFALHDSEAFRQADAVPATGAFGPELAKELIRAYYASISYVDAQVGRLLKALEDSGAAETTTVVLYGERGFHLGEHGLWGGNTNYENALRVPLIVRAPEQRGGGRKSLALTELVDLYPTLCDLSNVPMPEGLEGSAFTPLFEDPDRLWKRAVFASLPRVIPGVGPGMGRTMRTKRFRYTEWTAPGSPFRAAEVYDYREDPHETRNLVGRPEAASLVNGLAGMLQEGWQTSLPPTDPRGTSNS